MQDDRTKPKLVESPSTVTRAGLQAQFAQEPTLSRSIGAAHIILLSHEHIDSGPVFPAQTKEFYKHAVAIGGSDVSVEVACTESEYREVTLHSEEWRIPLLLLADIVAMPTLVNILSSYIYDRAKGMLPKREATVRSELIVETAEGSFLLYYTGPAAAYLETMSRGMESVMNRSGVDDESS